MEYNIIVNKICLYICLKKGSTIYANERFKDEEEDLHWKNLQS
jgi:hypothetical protein